MKTPIYIDYEVTYPNNLASNEFQIYEEDPIDIYTDPTVLDPLDTTNTLPYILAPRYYLRIHRPRNQPGPSITVPLHKSPTSLLNNKLRILLEPSIGWGVNGSYRVEYWKWVPNVNLPAMPTKYKVRTEFWYIPTLDREYVPRYPFDVRLNEWYPRTAVEFIHMPRRTSILADVERTIIGNTVSDLITDVNLTKLFCFPEDSFISFTQSIITEDLQFNSETRSWTFSKSLTGSTLVRDSSQVDGALVDGLTQTTIEYIEPLHPEQVTFYDYDDILNDGLVSLPYFI